MHKTFFSVSLIALTLGAMGSKLSSPGVSYVEREANVLFETHRAPSHFQKLEKPPQENHTITLQISLKNRRFDDSIDDLLAQMSDPTHPEFRAHLTDQEFAKLNQPDDESVEAVLNWLKSHGFEPQHTQWAPHNDWVKLDKVPLKKVEYMLDTTYSVYRSEDGENIIRTEKYSLPQSLHRHIDLVQPTTMFARLRRQGITVKGVKKMKASELKKLKNPDIPNTCSNPASVTNDCLRQLYKTDSYQVRVPQMNMIGVTGYLEEVANYEDAQLFLSTQRPDQAGGSFSIKSVHGGKKSQRLTQDEIDRQLGVEANLDTQTTLGFTLPMQNVFWSVGGEPPFNPDLTSPQNTNEPYLDWLSYILAQPSYLIPKVITTSYGDDEQTVPPSYARRACQGFASLGARGVSVIFSSGDSGVGRTGFCYSNDSQQNSTFLPIFPASCPYVTSVGATENFFPEVAASMSGPAGFTSGGGFSNYFSTPSWQKAAVDHYLNFLGPDAYRGLYNRTGRGFPDVSAQGSQYAIAWQNEFLTVGGTSAAAPTFASVIALLNDYLVSRGRNTMGFLNPWLYRIGYRGLNDIVGGSSSGCNTTGFMAIRGWDPVTGLGTPNFRKLMRLVDAA